MVSMSALLLLMASCGGNKTGSVVDEVSTDSVSERDVNDLDSLTEEISETPVPKAADGLFDDFIFNFAANKKLQMERILFPLRRVDGSKKEMIARQQWKMEYFFMRQGYYTLLFDNEEQMEVLTDTTVNQAIVERIDFASSKINQYVFVRPKGAWLLTAIRVISVSQSSNASFLEFYRRFSSDMSFQMESLGATVKFVGPDPDDDFNQMEGIITPDTWEAFAPQLPSKEIYNIIYGSPRKECDTKHFILRGIANGQELEMSFRRRNGKWLLTKLTT